VKEESMRKKGGLGVVLGAAAALAACAGPEKKIVDQYFTAVNAKDNQTLSSFALVAFDRKVDDWKITEAAGEERKPAALPELVQKVKDIEAQMAANKKEYNAYFLDHPQEVDQVRELLKKNAPIPARLDAHAKQWKVFTEKERDLKKALAEAKDAVEREKRHVQLSLGQVEEMEGLSGEVISKRIELALTIGGQSQPYVMTLRKYEMSGGQQVGRAMSRWYIAALEPKG
jgi:hypothetical protein